MRIKLGSKWVYFLYNLTTTKSNLVGGRKKKKIHVYINLNINNLFKS